jgi:hypothetical protein
MIVNMMKKLKKNKILTSINYVGNVFYSGLHMLYMHIAQFFFNF